MAILFLFDASKNEFEHFELSCSAAIPYSRPPFTLTDFCFSNCSNVLWTDSRLIDAYNDLCEFYGEALTVFGGFRHITKNTRNITAQNAGLSLVLGKNLSNATLEDLRRACIDCGSFERVSLPYETPTEVHVSVKIAPSVMLYRSPPRFTNGCKGVHVLALQSFLQEQGFNDCPLNGIFDETTSAAISCFFAHAIHSTANI